MPEQFLTQPKPEGPGSTASPFETKMFRLGQEGLNIRKSLDVLSLAECSRLSNVIPTTAGNLQTRPGLLTTATYSGTLHSIGRLNDPISGGATRFIGAGTQLLRGLGSLANVDNGYSGNPLTFLPYRPPLASASYMFVADSSKMSKTALTGPTLPIGLPAPAGPSVVVSAQLENMIASCSNSDNTQAASWILSPTDPLTSFSGSLVPTFTIQDNPPGGVFFSSVQAGAAASQAAQGLVPAQYISYAYINTPRDLSTIGGQASSDQDLFHVLLGMDQPQNVQEVRIYLLADTLADGQVPGESKTTNFSAYVRSIRPSDFSSYVAGGLPAVQAAQNNAVNLANNPPVSQSQFSGQPFVEFGVVGLPVRRGDFTKIGKAGQPGHTWANITAMFFWVEINAGTSCNFFLQNVSLRGGFGPDDTQPGALQYDYRVTHFDPRTGAESNPSATSITINNIQYGSTPVDAARQSIVVTPPAYGDSNIRQRIYRRGGSLASNWYFVGTNTADGNPFTDTLTDASILAAGAVFIDHDQPVTSINAAGAAVLNQPISSIWGPVASLIMGCGDPNRPGDVYWCKPGEPDHWPAANHVEVCSPSEQLLAGCVFGGQAFVFSRERGYLLSINLASTAASVVPTPTDCVPGLFSQWGIDVGPNGIYFIARDGIRLTKGGESQLISDPIKPLFHKTSANGLAPIDMTQPTKMRLRVHDNDVWFLYQDTNGNLQCLIFSIIYQNWRQYSFSAQVATVASDPTQQSGLALMVGGTNGTLYQHSDDALDDAGSSISCEVRSGSYDFGYARGETMFGDVIVDADMQGATLTVQTLINNEQTANTAQSVVGLVGRRRYVFDPFGIVGSAPQKARNIALDLVWQATASQRPIVEFAGVSTIAQPNTTMNRITSWDSPGPAECYLIGCWLDCDTFSAPRTITIEYDQAGSGLFAQAQTVTVNPTGIAGRHKFWFSWPVVKANMIRLRPADNCVPWELYDYEWLQQGEPPRIAGWDTNWENLTDAYCTGVNIQCDTFGATKQIQIFADQGSLGTFGVTQAGRGYVHLTIQPPIRASVFRFVATDTNPGLLYGWHWMTDPEPSPQTNWNQNYTIAGTLSDKFLKGALIECDTFNQPKTVTFEVDGVVQASPTVTANGRKVVEVSFPQALGRVFRMIPTDTNPGRLYSMEWIFDEEPVALSRWETQEVDHGITGWQVVGAAFITLKSNATVTLTMTIYGQSGTVMGTPVYTIPSTGGIKQKVYVPFNAVKGTLFKYVFTSASAFWLYRPESIVHVRPWGSSQSQTVRPFGDDDLDSVRTSHHAALEASHSGGGVQNRQPAQSGGHDGAQ